ncbi:hypothetical protein B0H67DRAFT_551162 [Lasiosphaeris hirsuta]|uniref:Uncharacterized protein n=1 Tax=Lasiosphaeris hirsuta TaxID=260670 RepID=A0AA40B0Y0_9PEZI|nr:hypothetical protein B0H67DRAFT_551162 [Lasiosphaeris hirsuta]
MSQQIQGQNQGPSPVPVPVTDMNHIPDDDIYSLKKPDLCPPIEDISDGCSPYYRCNCLGPNNVYFELPSNQLPNAVALQTSQLFTPRPKAIPTPGIFTNTMNELDRIGTRGGNEALIINCFLDSLVSLPYHLRQGGQ